MSTAAAAAAGRTRRRRRRRRRMSGDKSVDSESVLAVIIKPHTSSCHQHATLTVLRYFSHALSITLIQRTSQLVVAVLVLLPSNPFHSHHDKINPLFSCITP